jgi:Putative transmembrane protein (PGPGW)
MPDHDLMADAGPVFWDIRWPTGPEFALGVVLSVVMAGVSLLATGFILVRLPADYFAGETPPAFWQDRHPVLRWLGRVGKNVIGAILVVVGIILSLPAVPGQGLLTILIGLMFLDLPGKRRLEQKLVRQPRVLGAINRLRERYGRKPLVFELVNCEPPTSGRLPEARG